jgi:cellobiose phosphorylase
MLETGRLAETRYGYFDVDSREYVITAPGTPEPWLNYVGLEGDLCGIVSNHAGGPTWWRDPLERRITRYVQVGCNKDRPGRWLYVRDNATGEFWAATHEPVARPVPDSYECRHGPGYTRITSTTAGITAELLHFVPLGETVEVQRVSVRNDGDTARELSLFPYREFVNGDARSDLSNIQYSGHLAQASVDEHDDRVIWVDTNATHGRPQPFFAVSEPPAGFDTECAAFFGDGSPAVPQVVRDGVTTGSLAGDDTAVGVFQIDLTLRPGEERTIHLILGIADDRRAARQALARWLGDDGAVVAAFHRMRSWAVGLLGTLQCRLADPEAAVTLNTWNPYQCWVNFQFSRSISGHATGLGRSMGTRDSLQDLLGYMHMSPDGARARILELIGTVQQADGSCIHQYSALSKRGMGRGGYSDDHLWSVLAVAAYVKETGRIDILDERLAYCDDPGQVDDLHGHLLRAVRYSFNDRGVHGIPRLRAADWNDCIGSGPDDEISESTLVGTMLVMMARLLAEMTERSGRTGLQVEHDGGPVAVMDYLELVAAESARAVNDAAWREEGWYARATNKNGRWFGDPANEEARIYLEPQPWAVMAGVADHARGVAAMDSVRTLLATPAGIQIHQPGSTRNPHGGFQAYPKGAKENAGIFCHPNPWAVIAECILGRGDRAYEYYRAILPAAAHQEDPGHYTAEPYVYGQIRYGSEHRLFGKCAGTWLTGTAAWNYVAATQHILGVRPDWDGLTVDPCVPPHWAAFSVTRRFRNAVYEIAVANPDGVCKGVRSVVVDGAPIDGNTLPVFGDGAVHRVEVTMG